MSAVIDSCVLIDYLRDRPEAVALLEGRLLMGPLHASEITRIEVLAGMRTGEEAATYSALSSFNWHPIDAEIAERAGAMGRRWLPSHNAIGAADLAIAATAELIGLPLLTRNVRHYPMFEALEAPY